MKDRLLRTEVVVIVIIALVLTFILMAKPIIGIADNGDFQRIMGSTGLGYLEGSFPDKYIGFINRLYSVNDIPLRLTGYYISTEIFLVKFAILINRLAADNGIFDIRFLSLVYSAVFLFSIYLILKHNKQKSALKNWLLGILIIAVFTDIGYISYFNTLYGEAVSYTFLFLTVGIALYLVSIKSPKVWILVAFFIASLFLVGAKVQNVPIIAVIVLFSMRLWQIRKDKLWRYALVTSSIILIISSVAIYQSIPKGIKNCNKYQSVFYGVLKDSPNPAKDLEELGLDPKYAVLAGTNFFMQNLPYNLKDPAMEKEVYNKISRLKILTFYIKHPLRYINKLQNTAQNAFSIRQVGFGNYEKTLNTVFGQMSNTFSVWSGTKELFIPHSLLLVVIFYMFYFGILVVHHFKAMEISQKAYTEVFMFIGLIGLIQFFIPVLGDGEADLSKHLFLFNVCFDMMLVLSVVWVADKSLKLGRKLLVPRNRIRF